MKHKSILVTVSLVLVGALTLVLFPGAKAKRHDRLIKEFAKYSTIADQATWKRLQECTSFQQVSGKKYGDTFVFMPALRCDIAELAGSFTSPISEANVRIIPLPDKDSPTSEKFLKLCLVHHWDASNRVQQGIANGPRSNQARVDRMWEEVPIVIRTKTDAQLKENRRIYEELGKYGCYYSYDGIITKAPYVAGVITNSRQAAETRFN